ncbi:uncharacterized protein EV420DRAFT_416215 [Desarmillaria tabescens]|uniref:Secreted protein n=1 Tax=Armillaria tabescens TaxID=1929756 RepID=A0AA39KDT3_ARMTA|nr:uncharacterized protein EV420DRAFT_416215 [Desarmillaria tabescens]KAK0458115.1 hypothetical protein EV420DRAFT_416215 [Desarmillaria tabescens]
MASLRRILFSRFLDLSASTSLLVPFPETPGRAIQHATPSQHFACLRGRREEMLAIAMGGRPISWLLRYPDLHDSLSLREEYCRVLVDKVIWRRFSCTTDHRSRTKTLS